MRKSQRIKELEERVKELEAVIRDSNLQHLAYPVSFLNPHYTTVDVKALREDLANLMEYLKVETVYSPAAKKIRKIKKDVEKS